MSRALTFGRVAEAYACWRPGYPDDAVRWLAPRAPARVADLGAGTGKLSSRLIALGLAVDAVEPDPEMLAVLARDIPRAVPHRATSDSLPLDDGCLDAALVADAWHWFPVGSTIAEIRRVLRPGGWLGLVWNLVMPVESWEFEVAVIDPDQKGIQEALHPALPFRDEELERAWFPWVWEITPEHYAALLATNSAVIAMSEQQRNERMDAARSVLQRVCAETGSSTLPFHHVAACTRWTPQAENALRRGFRAS